MKDNLFRLLGNAFDPLNFPWELKTLHDYERAARACEIVVQLPADLHAALKRALRFDKRSKGSKGRRLTQDCPEVGLLADDRLEPSAVVRDVGAGFDYLKDPWPQVTFWRRGSETRLRHRNPLFSEELGVDHNCLQVGKLHCCYLGTWRTTSLGCCGSA